ncbi:MAG: 2-oxoacid:acceptor oxidoreductase subunit alpha [Dehalococcoidia bacterium]|nr:2-oxoacid:acceptor oxidoreductase subunit alpha [Dehalococcoidia bacterium]
MNGDTACAEGALAAGCLYFGGYPITPSTEIAERLAHRLPGVGGAYVQMEDELGSIVSVIGAAWGGVRSMTATSGPGFSLMMESIGLAAITETPCVIVNVMRGGPSTGLPTLVAQADVMQARWGTHGDIQAIALAPASCQEMFDLTLRAFNLADRFRHPVFILADEAIGHLTERVVIPAEHEITRVPRSAAVLTPGTPFEPFRASDSTLVPPMPRPGEGFGAHITSLTHDERGYPATDATTHDALVRRLSNKISRFTDEITQVEAIGLEDAEIAVVTYGSTSRTAKRAVSLARQEGIRAGILRLVSLWPFPDAEIAALSERMQAIVVAELNLGQVRLEVERVARIPVFGAHHAGGALMPPETILESIKEAARHGEGNSGRSASSRSFAAV